MDAFYSFEDGSLGHGLHIRADKRDERDGEMTGSRLRRLQRFFGGEEVIFSQFGWSLNGSSRKITHEIEPLRFNIHSLQARERLSGLRSSPNNLLIFEATGGSDIPQSLQKDLSEMGTVVTLEDLSQILRFFDILGNHAFFLRPGFVNPRRSNPQLLRGRELRALQYQLISGRHPVIVHPPARTDNSILQYSIFTPQMDRLGRTNRVLRRPDRDLATVDFYYGQSIASRDTVWVVCCDQPIQLFKDDWVDILRAYDSFGELPRAQSSARGFEEDAEATNHRGLSPDMEILLYSCYLASYAWRDRIDGTATLVGDFISEARLVMFERLHIPDGEERLFDGFSASRYEACMKTNLRLNLDLSALEENLSIVRSLENHFLLSKQRSYPQRQVTDVVLPEIRKAIEFLEHCAGQVQRLSRALQTSIDSERRHATRGQSERMEWAATESLKVSFVLQTFLKVVGFAVIFFLPPIFSSTFLSSTVFDIVEGGQWTVSSPALAIWLQITLPLTFAFGAVLYSYYWSATGLETPLRLGKRLLRLLMGKWDKKPRRDTSMV
ncbi:hypothetical protein QBC47DRAFT_369425 [Echria macrotheca]|uniref:Uncharacterized protein n=1 Tax=Echria macrotheca TaxID=438768 RepID=A0AAJ0FAD0_9PEZI|nr:hypothetical protein QBC47DRAFT_369425 [Echria macrotheca]